MATKTDICNYAITFIGGRPISSIDQDQQEAILCKRFYNMARMAVLRDHKWSFAKKSVALAVTTDTDFVGWDYAFMYPTDALYIEGIYNSASPNTNIEFEIRTNTAKNKKYIMSNEEYPYITYTANVDEEALFDSLFIEAFAYKLAAVITVPLNGNLQIVQLVEQKYAMSMAKAKASDSNEKYKSPTLDNSLLGARN
jgi:hypothetical protein